MMMQPVLIRAWAADRLVDLLREPLVDCAMRLSRGDTSALAEWEVVVDAAIDRVEAELEQALDVARVH